MISKQRVLGFYKSLKNDESGNVLLFSVIVLMFLVFVISVVSLSVVNRVRVVRKVADNNQVISEVTQYSQNVENSIQQIINECDELARYYVSRRYYTRDNTDYTQTGSNSSLDNYLNKLITTNFQLQIKTQMESASISVGECSESIFAYLVLVRGSDSLSVPGLKSIPSAIEGNKDEKLIVLSKSIRAMSGISEGIPTFAQILNAVRNSQPIIKIEFKLSYDTSKLLSNSKSIDTYVVYHLKSYKYALSGIDVIKPGADEIKQILETQRNQISTKMAS